MSGPPLPAAPGEGPGERHCPELMTAGQKPGQLGQHPKVNAGHTKGPEYAAATDKDMDVDKECSVVQLQKMFVNKECEVCTGDTNSCTEE